MAEGGTKLLEVVKSDWVYLANKMNNEDGSEILIPY